MCHFIMMSHFIDYGPLGISGIKYKSQNKKVVKTIMTASKRGYVIIFTGFFLKNHV